VRSCAAILLTAIACAGCSVAPVPAWQADTHDALESFREAYLAGNAKLAARYFARARNSASATGRPDLMARVELVRCGTGTAALDFDACGGYEALEAEATASDQAYGRFLRNGPDAADAAKLPEQYRDIAGTKDADAQNAALAKIEDPLSRLVAAGALFRAGRLSPAGLSTATDTASAQGWRNPLLAYLNVQLKQAEEAGNGAAVEAARKRISLILNP
jgi:hypothetical protein